MKNAYQLYIREIENIPPLSKKEEQLYFRLWKEKGNKLARMAIYKSNLRFVASVAHRYKNQGVDILDLISEGNFSLDTAMERFDYTTDNKLLSYAVWYIRQAMLELLARQSRFISITGTEAVQKATLDKAAAKLTQKLGRKPTEAEVAENIGFTIERVRHMERMLDNQSFTSLDVKMHDMNLQDILPDTKAKNPENINDRSKVIMKFLKDADLSEKQINVLTSYYGIKRHPRTLEDIRFDYNHSRERMRQIRDEALDKLRAFNKKTTIYNIPNVLEDVI